MAPLRFVSSNRGKFEEARAHLAPRGVEVVWVRRRLPELQASSLEEVVRAKAAAVRGVPGPFLVEDAGLFIEALNGFPGVYSAPMLATLGFDPILDLLRDRPRAASFRAVGALHWRGRTRLVHGRCEGVIAPRPRGQRGFGYDPIFVPRGARRTFGEMSVVEKSSYSHRGQVLTTVARVLTAHPGRPAAPETDEQT